MALLLQSSAPPLYKMATPLIATDPPHRGHGNSRAHFSPDPRMPAFWCTASGEHGDNLSHCLASHCDRSLLGADGGRVWHPVYLIQSEKNNLEMPGRLKSAAKCSCERDYCLSAGPLMYRRGWSRLFITLTAVSPELGPGGTILLRAPFSISVFNFNEIDMRSGNRSHLRSNCICKPLCNSLQLNMQ